MFTTIQILSKIPHHLKNWMMILVIESNEIYQRDAVTNKLHMANWANWVEWKNHMRKFSSRLWTSVVNLWTHKIKTHLHVMLWYRPFLPWKCLYINKLTAFRDISTFLAYTCKQQLRRRNNNVVTVWWCIIFQLCAKCCHTVSRYLVSYAIISHRNRFNKLRQCQLFNLHMPRYCCCCWLSGNAALLTQKINRQHFTSLYAPRSIHEQLVDFQSQKVRARFLYEELFGGCMECCGGCVVQNYERPQKLQREGKFHQTE